MTKILQIYLLGTVRLELDGRPLNGLPSRAAEALLIYLACEKRPFSREVLAELLWAERSTQQALTNLRTILSALRRELREHLLIQRDTLAFNLEAGFWLDRDQFEASLGRLAHIDDEHVTALQAALALYRGDFLSGFALRDGPGFEEWASLEQERLRRLAHGGFRRLAQHHLENANYPAGIQATQKLLALDPYDEESLRLLMCHLARNGQRNAALVQYESARSMLAESLGIQPATETLALYKRLRDLPFPPPNNLPLRQNFVGRAAELAEIIARLSSPTCRLVTLFGPGGIGKTRLALEAARQIVTKQPGQFLEGIFFMPLDTLDEAQNLALRLGDALGISFNGSDSPRSQVLGWLKEKELLVILDNVEHLLDHQGNVVSLIAEILRQAPRVKILVTSRQRLNLVEEWIFDVGGLEVPPPNEENPGSASSVALFLHVAQRLHRHFSPAGEEIQAIVHVCRMLEGVPLAIELAAGWTHQQSCDQIAGQVQFSLDFLHATQHNVSDRRRSLRMVFEHSWNLLDEAEKSAFRRLSVLRGDFDVAAASAVLAAIPLSEAQALLNTLLDRSLLHKIPTTASPDPRYRIHPILRQYTAEKLIANEEQYVKTLADHAIYFLHWLAGQGDGEHSAQRAAIRAEMANLRPAWNWAIQNTQAKLLAQAAPVLHNFYSAESRFVEGIEMFQFACEGLGQETARHATLLCDLLGRKARMQLHIGQLGAASDALNEAYALLEYIPHPERQAAILSYQAITCYYAGDYVRAAQLSEQAGQLSQAAGDLAGMANELNFLGSCHKARGDYIQASQHFERSAAVYRQLADALGEAMVLNNLGNTAQARGDFSTAQHYYMESSALFKAQDHAHGAATTLGNAGLLAYHQGAYDQAQTLLGESLAMKQAIGDQRGIAIAQFRLADVATATGSYRQARKYLLQAVQLTQQSGDLKTGLEILVAVADLYAHTGQQARAGRLLAFVLQQTAASQEARQRAEQLAGTLKAKPASAREDGELTYEAIIEEVSMLLARP